MSEQEDKIKIIFDTNAEQTKPKIDGLAKAVNETTDAVEGQINAQKTFKAQMREANIELQNAVQKYGETSKEAIESAKAVAKLRDQMQFAQDLSKQFNPDQKFKALGASTQLAGTGLQGVTSGMALFGDQSKDTQAQLLKVQSAMAFSDAISNLSNLSDQWELVKTSIKTSSVATKLNTAVTGTATVIQKAFTGSVATTTFGFKALKFAIASTGIGLLVVAVGLLVSNFDNLKATLFKAVPQLNDIGKSITKIVQSVTDFLGFTSEAERVHDKMTQKANKSIKDNEYLLEINAKKYDDYTKRKIQANIDYNKKAEELKEQLATKEIKSQKELDLKLKAFREKADKEIEQADIDRANSKRNNLEPKETIQKKEPKELKQIIDFNKIKLDKEKELQIELENLLDNTEQKKLDRQKERDKKEIENLGLKEKAKRELLDLNDKIYLEKQKELDIKNEEDSKLKAKEFLEQFKKEKEEKISYEDLKTEEERNKILENELLNIEKQKEADELRLEEMGGLTIEEKKQAEIDIDTYYGEKSNEEKKKLADVEINIEKAKAEQKKEITDRAIQNGEKLLGALAQGQIKNKAIQKTAIIAEGGIALGKNIANTASAVTSDLKLGFPLNIAPVALNIATGALSASQIIAGTQKALQAVGGGGSISSSGSAQAPQSVSAQPQLGIQSSSENQIATSILKNQKEMPPIKTYVVSSEVKTAQNLDAKLVNQNSF